MRPRCARDAEVDRPLHHERGDTRMSPITSAAAPAPGRSNGAGATNLLHHNSTPRSGVGPSRMGNRPLPADDLTCLTLAALRYREARERMHALGVGPEAFEFSEERAIA